MKKRKNNTIRQFIGSAAKLGLVLTVLFGPIVAAQTSNANTQTTVGELQKMSNGAGLVLVFGLQRG